LHRATGKQYAIKKTYIDNKNDGIPATTIREIGILIELDHPNIVALEDTAMHDNDIYFI
jgi:cyclin-dependent kinase 2